MQQSDGRGPVMVMVEDSTDARLFIELSSYGSDLTEARNALDLAIRFDEDGSRLSDASRYLIGFAVVAYCRTILPSNVRRRLTDYIEIPSELTPTNDAIRTFRNATIAHSQSDLSVTYPVGFLDPVTLDVRYVAGATVVNTLPRSLVHEFRTLVATAEELLDRAIEPVRARLEATLREADRRAMVARGPKPNAIHKFADDFNPKTKRPAYPTSHTFYWSQ